MIYPFLKACLMCFIPSWKHSRFLKAWLIADRSYIDGQIAVHSDIDWNCKQRSSFGTCPISNFQSFNKKNACKGNSIENSFYLCTEMQGRDPFGRHRLGAANWAPLIGHQTIGHRAVWAPDIWAPFPNLFLFFRVMKKKWRSRQFLECLPSAD